jgi:methylenetetrahydrofolate dehydrogenase (NADP+)/methenyltetrahydrofolate cyclohydrolase
MARLLEGKPVARAVLGSVRADLAGYVTRMGRAPQLAAVLTGGDPGAHAYFRAIKRTFQSVEMPIMPVQLPERITEGAFRQSIAGLNQDPTITGIIVLQPLPAQLPPNLPSLIIDPAMDVDGITPGNAGRLTLGMPSIHPSTPAGGIEILRYYDIPVEGKRAVVIGRSNVVGKPMSLLLLAANATVTICHSRTRELGEITKTADILASATGRPWLVTPDMVKPGAVVIDFGVNFLDGRLVGDVDPAVADVASALTPVPGGTGVVTNAILARNTLWAALAQEESIPLAHVQPGERS